MESKKLFEELFEEEDIEEYAGQQKKNAIIGIKVLQVDVMEQVCIHAHYGIYIAVTHQDIN